MDEAYTAESESPIWAPFPNHQPHIVDDAADSSDESYSEDDAGRSTEKLKTKCVQFPSPPHETYMQIPSAAKATPDMSTLNLGNNDDSCFAEAMELLADGADGEKVWGRSFRGITDGTSREAYQEAYRSGLPWKMDSLQQNLQRDHFQGKTVVRRRVALLFAILFFPCIRLMYSILFTDWQKTLSMIREQYQRRYPKSKKGEAILDNLWVEFGEIIKALEYCGADCPNVAAKELVRLWSSLEPTARGRKPKSVTDSAMDIVEIRQKRRKSRHVNRTQETDERPVSGLVKPWHIVLGDHSRRSKTIGTIALRYFCLQTKWCTPKTDSLSCLAKTRELLSKIYPKVESCERGKIMCLAGARSDKKCTFADGCILDEGCLFAFDREDKARFAVVPRQREASVVKRVFCRVTPATDRSLAEVATAYRVLLENLKQDSTEIRNFRDLLDFVDLGAHKNLSQTAINGLRETLDARWAELEVDLPS